MTADDAIKAHRLWKERLRTAMATREPLSVEKIARDDCCEFGMWLHSEAKAMFGSTAAYLQCVSVHAAFHVEASKVASKVNEGELLAADQLMATGTPYAKTSEELTIKVKSLFNAAAT